MKMFPPTKFINELTLVQQFKHLRSEVEEVKEELWLYINPKNTERRKRIILELLDVKHSADTLLRMLGVTEEEHTQMSNYVIYEKNFPRGYYNTKKEA